MLKNDTLKNSTSRIGFYRSVQRVPGGCNPAPMEQILRRICLELGHSCHLSARWISQIP